jgi:hypothetical protein
LKLTGGFDLSPFLSSSSCLGWCYCGVGFSESTESQQRQALGNGWLDTSKHVGFDYTFVNDHLCSLRQRVKGAPSARLVLSLLCNPASSAPQPLATYTFTVIEESYIPLRWQQQHAAAQAVQFCSL